MSVVWIVIVTWFALLALFVLLRLRATKRRSHTPSGARPLRRSANVTPMRAPAAPKAARNAGAAPFAAAGSRR
ncbi:MAG TPA: hypothetical protein VN889_01960 [Solirubrobacteraceae bacterium]|nr:hypothetical protein [Solirubrobacteraceae bacterium]